MKAIDILFFNTPTDFENARAGQVISFGKGRYGGIDIWVRWADFTHYRNTRSKFHHTRSLILVNEENKKIMEEMMVMYKKMLQLDADRRPWDERRLPFDELKKLFYSLKRVEVPPLECGKRLVADRPKKARIVMRRNSL